MSWFRETMLKAESKADQFESWVKDSVSSGADRTEDAAGDDASTAPTNSSTTIRTRPIRCCGGFPGYSGYKDKEHGT